MARLSTPSHQCSVKYVHLDGTQTGQLCGWSAYRKNSRGQWRCRTHSDRRMGQSPHSAGASLAVVVR